MVDCGKSYKPPRSGPDILWWLNRAGVRVFVGIMAWVARGRPAPSYRVKGAVKRISPVSRRVSRACASRVPLGIGVLPRAGVISSHMFCCGFCPCTGRVSPKQRKQNKMGAVNFINRLCPAWRKNARLVNNSSFAPNHKKFITKRTLLPPNNQNPPLTHS